MKRDHEEVKTYDLTWIIKGIEDNLRVLDSHASVCRIDGTYGAISDSRVNIEIAKYRDRTGLVFPEQLRKIEVLKEKLDKVQKRLGHNCKCTEITDTEITGEEIVPQ
jgi:hypothetical protein